MAEASTSSISIRFLVDLLDLASIEVNDLLQAANLDRAMLELPDLRCPLTPFDAIWRRAAALQPDIGLTLIERFPVGQMHIVTHLALRSACVRDALAAVERYVRITQVHDQITVRVMDQRVSFDFYNPDLHSQRRQNPWLVEHLLSMSHVLFERACGRPLPLLGVCFHASRQAPETAYLRRFGLNPEFGAASNSLVFDVVALDWPLHTHDAYLRGILENFATQQLPRAPQDLLQQVCTTLRTAWLSGTEPSFASTAAALGLSHAQLRGRLTANKHSFRQIKDDSRRDLARIHLAGPMATGEIAYLLGFSEPAALQHACQRWFERSVGEYRRELADHTNSRKDRS